MRTWKPYCAGLALLAGLTPTLFAQQPGVAGAPPGAAGAAAAAAPAGPNLFTMLCIPEDKKAKCLECVCKIPLLRGMINGVGGVAGMAGLMPGPICPDPVVEAAKGKPPDAGAKGDAAAAAAKIKAIEADAKARRAAIRYLGTVDCRYFPEAEKALVTGLRFDPIECVRWEAAMALGSGCCCSKTTMQALVDSLSSNPKDGGVAETSERVRAAAHFALNNCLSRYEEVVPAKKKEIPIEPGGKPVEKPLPPVARQNGEIDRTAYYEQVQSKTMQDLVQEARRTLTESNEAPGTMVPAGAAPMSGNRGLFQIMSNTRSSRPASSTGSMTMPTRMERAEPAPAERVVVPAHVQEPCDDGSMDPLPRLIHKIKGKSESSRPLQRNQNRPAPGCTESTTPVQTEPARQQGSSQGMLPTLSNRLGSRQGTPRQMNSTYVPTAAQAVRETRTVVTTPVREVSPVAPASYAASSRTAGAVAFEPDPSPDEESFAADREEEVKHTTTTGSSRRFKMPWSK